MVAVETGTEIEIETVLIEGRGLWQSQLLFLNKNE